MVGALTRVDDEAVTRSRRLLVFNQISALLAVAAALVFYMVWIQSAWLLVGVGWMFLFLVILDVARRSLIAERITQIGLIVLVCNWVTAVVLTALGPFSFPLGVLQVVIPVLAGGPVLERRLLTWVVSGATVMTGVVCAVGLLLDETELNDAVDENVQDLLVIFGVPVLTIAVGMAAWDAHQRQQLALERALVSNDLIRQSRARLVTAADQERRRIERDLHDGAQQQLVAVTMQLRLLRSVHDLDEELAPLIGELEESLEQLRDLANGIYPPVLRSSGLREAIRAAAARSPLDVDVDVDVDGRRFDGTVEASIYFCVLEALQNALKHAGSSAAVEIRCRLRDNSLVGLVQDDGPGFDVLTDERGLGLRNMEDRIVAVGGEFGVDGSEGTRIEFEVPV